MIIDETMAAEEPQPHAADLHHRPERSSTRFGDVAGWR
jgi:hypothetical protein